MCSIFERIYVAAVVVPQGSTPLGIFSKRMNLCISLISLSAIFFFGLACRAANDETAVEVGTLGSINTENDKRESERVEASVSAERKYHLPYVIKKPLVPMKWDYGAEVGGLINTQNNYWVGANIGRHMGTCMFSFSETCQQYFDLLGGIGGRESYTHYLGLASLRWQFIHFPEFWSPFVRVMGGYIHSIEPDDVRRRLTYGAGLGVATYLHERMDLRMEWRLMAADGKPWGQLFLSFQLKVDEWVDYFATKVKDLGTGVLTTLEPIEAKQKKTSVSDPAGPAGPKNQQKK